MIISNSFYSSYVKLSIYARPFKYSSPRFLSYTPSDFAITTLATELPNTLTHVLNISKILSTPIINASPCGFNPTDPNVVNNTTIEAPVHLPYLLKLTSK